MLVIASKRRSPVKTEFHHQKLTARREVRPAGEYRSKSDRREYDRSMLTAADSAQEVEKIP